MADAEPLDEIAAQRELRQETLRATVPALEEILYRPLQVLDHGFIRVVDYMGDDAAIVQAARVSYGKGTKQVSNDRGLINYLMRNHHSSPFEMCELKIHVKLPIFVARQWIRHRTANVNEYSARYSVLDREFYLPDEQFITARREERKAGASQSDLFGRPASAPAELAVQSLTNKQGRDAAVGDAEAEWVRRRIQASAARGYTDYERLLNEPGSDQDPGRRGIARELARMVLPLNTYTQMYWKIDLHNLLHFVRLRADSHAQYEIRAYAEILLDVLRRWVPLTLEAFEEHRRDGAELSAKALAAVRRRLQGATVNRETSGLSASEWRALTTLLPELEA